MQSELFMSHMCMVRGKRNSQMSFSKGSALGLLEVDQNAKPHSLTTVCVRQCRLKLLIFLLSARLHYENGWKQKWLWLKQTEEASTVFVLCYILHIVLKAVSSSLLGR